MKRLRSPVHCAELFADHRAVGGRRARWLDVDGEGGRGQEVLSPDRRYHLSVKATSLGLQKQV